MQKISKIAEPSIKNKQFCKSMVAISMCFINCSFADSTVNLNNIQAKNESQINQVANQFGGLKKSNTQNINKINMESAQTEAKMKISNLVVGQSNMPNIDMNNLKQNIDINKIISDGQKALATSHDSTDISLYLSLTTMPIDEVMLYSGQAVKYKIPIVLRGFINNSYKDTSKYLMNLRELYPELTIMIDPPAYDKYEINLVPALVVTKNPDNPLKEGCNNPGDFVKVTGEASVQGMLDYVRQYSKNPLLAEAATERLNSVRENYYFKMQ